MAFRDGISSASYNRVQFGKSWGTVQTLDRDLIKSWTCGSSWRLSSDMGGSVDVGAAERRHALRCCCRRCCITIACSRLPPEPSLSVLPSTVAAARCSSAGGLVSDGSVGTNLGTLFRWARCGRSERRSATLSASSLEQGHGGRALKPYAPTRYSGSNDWGKDMARSTAARSRHGDGGWQDMSPANPFLACAADCSATGCQSDAALCTSALSAPPPATPRAVA